MNLAAQEKTEAYQGAFVICNPRLVNCAVRRNGVNLLFLSRRGRAMVPPARRDARGVRRPAAEPARSRWADTERRPNACPSPSSRCPSRGRVRAVRATGDLPCARMRSFSRSAVWARWPACWACRRAAARAEARRGALPRSAVRRFMPRRLLIFRATRRNMSTRPRRRLRRRRFSGLPRCRRSSGPRDRMNPPRSRRPVRFISKCPRRSSSVSAARERRQLLPSTGTPFTSSSTASARWAYSGNTCRPAATGWPASYPRANPIDSTGSTSRPRRKRRPFGSRSRRSPSGRAVTR